MLVSSEHCERIWVAERANLRTNSLASPLLPLRFSLSSTIFCSPRQKFANEHFATRVQSIASLGLVQPRDCSDEQNSPSSSSLLSLYYRRVLLTLASSRSMRARLYKSDEHNVRCQRVCAPSPAAAAAKPARGGKRNEFRSFPPPKCEYSIAQQGSAGRPAREQKTPPLHPTYCPHDD